jgi:predicted metal-dependent TIM-barrel fold hydrolase
MLDRATIVKLFEALNAELRSKGVKGEIGICGGAVMCLVFRARESTKDIDAIFRPTREIREASKVVAAELGVNEDWLNDAAKGYFLSQPPVREVMDLSNLRVWAPHAEYMLAMKCVSARFDSHDLDDARFLLDHLRIATVDHACRIVEDYYPRKAIPAKTQFLLEELLQRRGKSKE